MRSLRVDPRGSSFLPTLVVIAVFAAVLLAGCTGTPSGGSALTAAPTTRAVNASAAGAEGTHDCRWHVRPGRR